MKRLMSLLQYVLEESGTWCRTSTDRDWKTILDRVEHEGLSFMTITLPNFAKDFEKSLSLGMVLLPSESKSLGIFAYGADELFIGWKRRGRLPVFLGGFLELVFDRTSGLLKTDTDLFSRTQRALAIRCIRQICLLYSKLNEPCSPERESKAILQYILCETEVKEVDARFLAYFGFDILDTRWSESRGSLRLKSHRGFRTDIHVTLLEFIYELGSIDPYWSNNG